jgi:MFS transporter, PAT family, beta-lactamase induction signal transducer AmpG
VDADHPSLARTPKRRANVINAETKSRDKHGETSAIWRDRRLWLMAAYGFVAGLPLPLSTFTLRYWLSESGATLSMIGLTANIGLAYSLKFLWSPVFDQIAPLSPTRRLGRRRGWLATIQPALVLAAVLLALTNPVASPLTSITAAALVAFLSASQDIAIDAWRIESFPQRLQGQALAAYVWGYRFALLAATTGVIWTSGHTGWHLALLGVAVLLVLGPIVTLLAPEPPTGDAKPPGETAQHGTVASRAKHAIIDPLLDFLTRPGAVLILAFVALFKLGEAMGGIMTAPFYRALGFTRDVIAGSGPFSLVATLAGITCGGWLVARIGVGRALLWTGSAQTVAMVMYEVLAHAPGQIPILYATVAIEAFAQGMADAAFLTYLSGLCSRAFTATHYALLSSIPALAIHTIGGFSGVLAGAAGWVVFYAICTVAALPAMGLMVVLLHLHPPEKTTI